jgi:hypothetical protein
VGERGNRIPTTRADFWKNVLIFEKRERVLMLLKTTHHLLANPQYSSTAVYTNCVHMTVTITCTAGMVQQQAQAPATRGGFLEFRYAELLCVCYTAMCIHTLEYHGYILNLVYSNIGLWVSCVTLILKTELKIIRANYFPRKCDSKIFKLALYVFLNVSSLVWCDYDLKYMYLNPELPPMWDFGSQYFPIRHIFVCGSLFREINSMRFIPQKIVPHTKVQYAILAEIPI